MAWLNKSNINTFTIDSVVFWLKANTCKFVGYASFINDKPKLAKQDTLVQFYQNNFLNFKVLNEADNNLKTQVCKKVEVMLPDALDAAFRNIAGDLGEELKKNKSVFITAYKTACAKNNISI